MGFQMVISLLMFEEIERSKVKVKNQNRLISLKRIVLGTKFVSLTDRKTYMGFQMVLSLLMLDDLERSNSRSKIKISL